jgi:hypothetical protein
MAGGLVHAGLGELVNGVEALFHLPARVLPRRFAVEAQVRQRGLLVPGWSRWEELPEQPRMPFEDSEEDLAQVQQQMEAVGNLSCLRGDATGGRRIFTAAIPADDIHTWMSEQPGGELVATAVGKDSDDVMSLQIDHDAALGPTAAEGAVVHTENTGSGPIRQMIGTQVCQDRIATGRDATGVEQARARFASRGKSQMQQPVTHALSAASLWNRDPWKALGKDAAGTVQHVTRVAKEAAGPQDHARWDARPGQIGQDAAIAGVHSP